MDGNQTLSRRRFLVTGVTAAGGFVIGLSALPRLANAVTVAAQPADVHDLDGLRAIGNAFI